MLQESSVLEINLDTIAENARRVVTKCRDKGIEVVGVTKGFSAHHEIVRAMMAGGIDGLADARMENIMELRNRHFHNPFTLLRIPRLSNVDNVVRYAETSINSEITVVEALSAAARRIKKIHNVLLMVDVGDLREGVLQENVLAMAAKIEKLQGVNLAGLGTNMGCYGGVLPSYENLTVLITLRDLLERKLDCKLEEISGGGTSSLLLVETDNIPDGINQLRIGEGILLGTDTTNSRRIPWLLQDAFHLRAEIIEVKEKPSLPIGEIGRDAFGNVPHFDDVGILKRAIVSLGKQDVYVEGLCPLEEKHTILGASSDHIIVDITGADAGIKVGDQMCFTLTYPGLLSASDSRYIKKEFKGGTGHES